MGRGESRPTRSNLDDVSVGIAAVDRSKSAALEDVGAFDFAAAQIIAPRLMLGRCLDNQGKVVDRADTHHTAWQFRVLHEGDQRARRAVERPEPDVASLLVVIGWAVVHDSQAKDITIKSDGPHHVSADGGDVMQAAQLHSLGF